MSRFHELIKNDPRWHAARRECFDRDGGVCTVLGCGVTEGLQADHIIPLSILIPAQGDPFDINNLTTKCASHNASKGNRIETAPVRLRWINPKYVEVLESPALEASPFF